MAYQFINPGASSDDASCDSDGGNYSDTEANAKVIHRDRAGTDKAQTIGIRFPALAVANAATINFAQLRLFSFYETGASPIVVRIQCEDGDDAATFSSGSKPTDRTLTTAYEDWDVGNDDNWAANLWSASPNIAAVVQEVVDRGGWASGQDVAVILNDNGTSSTTSFDGHDLELFDRGSTAYPQLFVVSGVDYGTGPYPTGIGFQVASTSSPMTVQVPLDRSTGEYTLMFVASKPSGTAGSNDSITSTGWTNIASHRLELGTNDLQIDVFELDDPDTTPTTASISHGTAFAGTEGISAFIMSFAEVDTASPLDIAIVESDSTDADQWAPTGGTTATASTLALAFVATEDDNALALATDQSFALWAGGEQFDTTVGTDHAVGLAVKPIPSASTAVTCPTFDQTRNGTDSWVGMFIVLKKASAGTNAAAGNAAGTGAANTAQTAVAPTAGSAASTGTVTDATPSVAAPSTEATASGAANDATVTRTGNADAVEATSAGAANAPNLAVSTPAAEATSAGVANDATVTTATVASAETAAGVGVGHDPTTTRTGNPQAATATGVGAANDATVTASGNATAATAIGVGTAYNATVTTSAPTTVAPTLNVSAGTFAYASEPTPTAGEFVFDFVAGQIAPLLAHGTTGAATNANAATATGVGAANDATVSIAPSGTTGDGTGTANTATGTLATTATAAASTGAVTAAGTAVSAAAGTGTGTGTAEATVSVAATATEATAAGAAHDATVSTSGATNAPADPATSAGTAETPTVSVAPNAGESVGTGTGNAATGTLSVNAAAATSAGVANDATVNTDTSTNVAAAAATGAGVAYSPGGTVAPTVDYSTGTGTGNAATATLLLQPAAITVTGTAQQLAAAVATAASAATGAGVAYTATPVNSFADPNALTVTIEDTGHNVTMRDTGHTVTIRTKDR